MANRDYEGTPAQQDDRNDSSSGSPDRGEDLRSVTTNDVQGIANEDDEDFDDTDDMEDEADEEEDSF